jgi:hypothetical protein
LTVATEWAHNLNHSPCINTVNLQDCKLSYRVAHAS